MTISALIMLIFVTTSVTAITVYFFWRVLKTPPRQEPDSFEDNDPE